jgi:YD repeat-containing protein
MIRLILIYLLISSKQFVFCQIDITEAENWKTLNLNGKVKMIKEVSFKGKKVNNLVTKSGPGWQYDFENDSESFFDTLGNLVLENNIQLPQKEITYSIKTNDQNQIISLNRPLFAHEFSYDSLNRIVSSWKSSKQPKKPSKETTPPEKTTVRSYYTYFYDSTNLLVKTEIFDENSNKTGVETFQYNANKDLVLRRLVRGEYTETHQYEYNDAKQLIRHEWRDSEEGILETTAYTYKNGVKVTERWTDYENGRPDGYIEDTFLNGNCIKSVEADTEGESSIIESCIYQLDDHRNWIKKTIIFDDTYFVVERTIEYY